MNYITHLNAFFAKLQTETRLRPHHISLYMALFACWNQYRFCTAFFLSRQRLMRTSGIGSKTTYFKCLKELHHYGYIIYRPALHRHHGAKVSMITWGPGAAPVPVPPAPGPEPDQPQAGIVPPAVPGMGQLQLRIGMLPGPEPGQHNKQDINKGNRECKTPAHHPPVSSRQEAMPVCTPPDLQAVQDFFCAAGFPPEEAPLFFHHYQANGWKQAGKTPITNWQAAAHKWIAYTKHTNTNPYGHHPTNTDINVRPGKNYGDPL
ncbi:hypothetical protein [Chitinophaga japonensis]|uniref:Uncharacterized protein n=1 Tax=Chitinophaga japonensis TaxID=104662 RepID=A0A562SZE7_CHIJA|nr:hypothetical protein [Chitinophaga japonensis]TWI86675.1 hypothetical protein LX66_3938 [Chitinophaga japonensis]